MDTKIYIIALSFAAITLVVECGAKFPFGGWLDPTKLVYSNISQVPLKTQAGEGENLPAYHPPVYTPPADSAGIGGRVGGNGRSQESVTLFALVPDHLGLTIDPQPTLYWYLSNPTSGQLILTVHDTKRADPIVNTMLRPSRKGGIYSVPLQAFNITLRLNTEYQWFVKLVMNPQNPNQDVIAGGTIKRIVASERLRNKLKNAQPEHVTAIYSEEGLWYDALASISDLCKSSPKGNFYCLGRKELLEQVDLPLNFMEIAIAEDDISLSQDLVPSPSPIP